MKAKKKHSSQKRKKKNTRKKSKKNKGLYSLLSFVALSLLLASLLGEGGLPPKNVAYSEIRKAISDGRVEKVFLGETKIEARLKEKAEENKEAEQTKNLKKAAPKSLHALRIDDKDLVNLLEKNQVQYEGRRDTSLLGEFFFTWILPILFLFFLWQLIIGRAFKQGGPQGLMSFGKSRAKLVDENEKNRVTFKEVAGCDEVKEELSEIIDFLKSPNKYKEIGGKIPKGVLLVGPPGTGKTLIARAVAGEASVSFFQISGSDFVEMFVGVGAARVRDLFQEAQKKSPCIIFIDELDAVAKSRSNQSFASNDERENTLNQILVEMDGFDNHSGIILMAATNRPEVLDPAILRPGRFDRQIVVDRPDIKGREEILIVHSKKIKVEEGISFRKLAARTPMFSGADLANVVNEAALLAVRKNLKTVPMSCFEEAIDRVMAGIARKSRVLPADEKKTVAVHEVGHALVAHFSDKNNRVHRISIIPRSSGALGFILQIPEEERHLMTEESLRSRIRVLLGGRAAEKVILGKVTTGAQDDLKRASEIIRRMISEFGMSESIGLVSLGSKDENYAGNPFVQNEFASVSEETAQKIDVEMRKILEEEYQNAQKVVREKEKLLHEMVTELLEKEVIEAEELKKFLPIEEKSSERSAQPNESVPKNTDENSVKA